ncbi:MAG: hypothetical protein EOO90_18300 [Pedobacter sp.]|nr:MAG: hypothetical protein EOO90_18300 [Pedobacter sp.]
MLGTTALAQQDSIASAKNRQSSIQLNLGTQGIGAEFNYGLSSQLALRAGASFVLPIPVNNVFKIDDFKSTTSIKGDFQNIHLLLDFTPIKNAAWLRLVGGAAYFLTAEGKVKVTPTDNYNYGDLILTQDQVGYLDMNIDWKGVAPYFGLGLGRVIPKNKFNINFDLGTYYLSSPKASIAGTGLLSGNSSQSEQFQSNLSDYKWLPVLQLNLNFKL